LNDIKSLALIIVSGFLLGCMITYGLFLLSGGRLPIFPAQHPPPVYCAMNETVFMCNDYFVGGAGQLNLSMRAVSQVTVTGLLCTKQDLANPEPQMLQNPAIFAPSEIHWVSGGNSGNAIFCTGSNGERISIGTTDWYEGNIYIAYRQVNGETRVAKGHIVAHRV